MHRGINFSTRLAIAIVALVVATAGAVGYLGYRNVAAVAVPRTLVRLDANARALAADLANIVMNARADVQGFRYIIGLDEIVALSRDPSIEVAGGQTLQQWRDRISRRLAAELEAKPNYAQFRIIGLADGGREIIRAERMENGTVRVVPNEQLQRKGDTGYFKRALAAQDGTVLLSPVELNQEDGAIASPHMPVIRISTPIFDAAGVRFGLLIANVDLRATFRDLRDATNPDATVYVVNDRGDFLRHPDRRQEFGFEFGSPHRIQQDFPSLAQAIATGQQQPEVTTRRDGQRFGVAFAPTRLLNETPMSIVEVVPEDKIVGVALAALRDSSLLGGTIAVLCAVLSAILLARTMTKPLSEMTEAVAKFSEDAPLVVPLTAGGEIGILARAFKKMVQDVRAKTAANREDKEVFESIMATMAEAVLLVDLDGNLIYHNRTAAAKLGLPDGFERTAWNATFELFYPDGVTPLPRAEWPSQRCLRGESVDEYELQLRSRGDGHLKHLLCSTRPLKDTAGLQTGAVVVFRDVTEAKDTERRLHQSQKLESIGQLTGGIAHDFNNILTVITGTAEILVEGVADRPQLATVARMIDEAANRGAELTRHLLAFARKQPLQPSDVDVNKVVLGATQLLRPTLGEQIEITSKLEAGAAPAHIDPSQLSAALLNLAVNARDAMPKGGKLLLETASVTLDESYAATNPDVLPGAYVLIAVSDTGTGIPAAIRDKVFEPFFTTKEIGRGTGLGLSMVYGFVKQSNGHVKIYSEEGYGTTIKLYLPCATGVAAASDQKGETETAAEDPTETILVVEDDALVRDFVVKQLHNLGYKTVEAASGSAALALVDGGASFDLLFTDIVMPGGMNGRELADAVALRRPVRVLFSSGYTEDAIVHHGRLDAGVLLLPKPYRRSDLARMIRTALGAEPTAAVLRGTAAQSTATG